MANVATIRPDKKAMKIAYKVLKTPKELQQDGKKAPSEKLIQEWQRDSMLSQ